jgi:hypothetical protein
MDCSGIESRAVAVCVDCGAAICRDHVVVGLHQRTVVRPLNRRVPVDPPARLSFCRTCDAARQAEAVAG